MLKTHLLFWGSFGTKPAEMSVFGIEGWRCRDLLNKIAGAAEIPGRAGASLLILADGKVSRNREEWRLWKTTQESYAWWVSQTITPVQSRKSPRRPRARYIAAWRGMTRSM